LTAYELFKRAYTHYMGSFMRRLYDGTNPKPYILQSFEDELNEYTISVDGKGSDLMLTFVYDYNPANKNQCNKEYLKSIEVQAGYYLCYYDGHTGDWLLMLCVDKSEAFETYKRFYQRYFRKQTWIHTLKI